jgi:hypothetical protein
MRANGAPDDKEPERVRDPDSIDMVFDIVDHFDWCAPPFRNRPLSNIEIVETNGSSGSKASPSFI